MARGDAVNVGRIASSPHVGTHVDAPWHVDDNGGRVGALPLDAFWGPAWVVDARGHDRLDVDLFVDLDIAAAPRLLVRTQEHTDVRRLETEFPVLTPAAIAHLAVQGCRLFGVDVCSVDAVDSTTLPVHRAMAAAAIPNVENLLLDAAPTGIHMLSALPVSWPDMDAAPLRAVLSTV